MWSLEGLIYDSYISFVSYKVTNKFIKMVYSFPCRTFDPNVLSIGANLQCDCSFHLLVANWGGVSERAKSHLLPKYLHKKDERKQWLICVLVRKLKSKGAVGTVEDEIQWGSEYANAVGVVSRQRDPHSLFSHLHCVWMVHRKPSSSSLKTSASRGPRQ